MAPRIAALAALGLMTAALASCSHETVAADGYRWAYLAADDADAPRLAYGRPDSDDVVLMMSCQPGRDEVNLSALGLSGAELVLASGAAESHFTGATIRDAMSEAELLEASGKTTAPALEGFKRSGDLAVLSQGGRHSLTAGSADRNNVRAFFRACGA